MIDNLINHATSKGISLTHQSEIIREAVRRLTSSYLNTPEYIRDNFDKIFYDTLEMIYVVYLEHQERYGREVMQLFAEHLIASGEITDISSVGRALGGNFSVLDRFFLSLKQSRTMRAGQSFEKTVMALFRTLGYPFTEQPVINGKPDFILPSREYYEQNAPDCIIFTSKRTVRERWRQIVTEGTRGLGFFLATQDDEVSASQLQEMIRNRVRMVVPQQLKSRISHYRLARNVLSFSQFFTEHVDPAMARWKRLGVI